MLLLYFILVKQQNLLTTVFTFIPLICVACWRTSSLLKFYEFFKNYIVFYAIVSIIVEGLVLSGLWKALPHMVYPPQDAIQESQGINNFFYGLFCIPTNGFFSIYRACGPLREGGHFSFFVGFVYFVENVLYGRRNKWLIIAGLLTLSPNFLLFLLVAESYSGIFERRFFKVLAWIVGSISVFVVLAYYAPQYLKDQVVHVVMERTLERNIENMGDEGFMALIDGRASINGLMMYDSFTKSDAVIQLFGFSKIGEDYTMSDFRYVLLRFGYIGMILYLLSFLAFTVVREKNVYGICVLLMLMIVFIQRAWMFNQVYFWVMALLIINKKQSHETLKSKKVD